MANQLGQMDEFDQFLAQSHPTSGSTSPYQSRQGSLKDRDRGHGQGGGLAPQDTSHARHSTGNYKEQLQESIVDNESGSITGEEHASHRHHYHHHHHNRILSHVAHHVLDDWDIGNMRPRMSSMPSVALPSHRAPSLAALKADPDTHRVRSFTIKGKGVINQGVVSSSTSVASFEGSDTPNHYPPRSETATPIISSKLKIYVFGIVGVGKRALIHTFLEPEECPTINMSIDDDGEKTVSILLDGEESTMDFIDVSDEEVDQYLASKEADAYVVVYSVEDRESFEGAIDRLYEIRKVDHRNVAVILVANKADLVRSRVVLEEEGRSAAKTYDCKYIEVSAAIEHKVNDLLVGILKQIRLIREKVERSQKHHKHKVKLDESCCLLRARQNVLGKLLRTDKFSSKSCDNLYVL